MPVYEYECERCGVIEVYQSINAQPLQECPQCGGKVRKLVSRNVSVLYKGSGFHTTDYRSEDYKRKQKEEKDTSKKDVAAS